MEEVVLVNIQIIIRFDVVICRQELFHIRDLLVRARFVYGCTCKCMECCSNLIGQTNQINLTMQHDNG